MLVSKNWGLQGAFTLAQATSPVKVPADGAMDGRKHWEAWVRPHINKEKGQVTGSYWYATPMVAVDCLAEVRKDFPCLFGLFVCLFVRLSVLLCCVLFVSVFADFVVCLFVCLLHVFFDVVKLMISMSIVVVMEVIKLLNNWIIRPCLRFEMDLGHLGSRNDRGWLWRWLLKLSKRLASKYLRC